MFSPTEKQILQRIKYKSIIEEKINPCLAWIDFVFLFRFVPFTK